MNKYKIYSTDEGVHTTIKLGWSWEGFFTVICMFAIIMGTMELFSSSLFVDDRDYIIWMSVFQLIGLLFAVLYAIVNNKRKEKILNKGKKYCYRTTVSDKSEGKAIYNYITRNNRLKQGGGY